jgi:hypothetical protein
MSYHKCAIYTSSTPVEPTIFVEIDGRLFLSKEQHDKALSKKRQELSDLTEAYDASEMVNEQLKIELNMVRKNCQFAAGLYHEQEAKISNLEAEMAQMTETLFAALQECGVVEIIPVVVVGG